MWHLCRPWSRSTIGLTSFLAKQHVQYRIDTRSAQQRWTTFRNFSKLKKEAGEPIPQPPVNPRHPPGYVPPQLNPNPYSTTAIPSQSNIFARFRYAYAKYGKILLGVHFASSFGWFSGLLALHFNGLDLGMHVIDGLARFHIITEERRDSFVKRMNEFSISGVINRLPLLSQEKIDRLNAFWTGERLRFLATTLILYKVLTPVRYAFTLGVTAYVSRLFLKRGLIQRAPKGDTLQELYRDQKQLINSHVRRARDQMKTSVRRGKPKADS